MDPDLFVLGAVIILARVVAALVVKKRQRQSEKYFSYESNISLFTPAEKTFLGVIEIVLENSNYRVFGKVHLGDLIKPAKGMEKNKFAAVQNRINQKLANFVVCRRDDLSVIAVIELDDRSQETKDRKESVSEADDVFTSANIPCLHIKSQAGYALSDVKEKLATVGVDVGAVMSITEQVRTRHLSRLMPTARPDFAYLSQGRQP
jgi:hypothetical protein